MNRRAALMQAAHWAMREDEKVLHEAPPREAPSVQALLDDPALGDALAEMSGIERLSDADIRAMRQRRRHAAAALLAGVLVVGAGSLSALWMQPEAPVVAHYETGRGERRTVQLADGSMLRLDGATSLDVTIGEDRRQVELNRGAAYFDVAHDETRPFLVHAGESGTRVLGTAFTVNLVDKDVRLAVYRGRVRFGAYGEDKGSVLVSAGWRSRFSGGAALVPTRLDAARPDRQQSWIDTNDMELGELVDALNRHHGPSIAAPPAELAKIELAGRFKLDDARGLLEAMGEIYGFEIAGDEKRIRLVAVPPDVAEQQ